MVSGEYNIYILGLFLVVNLMRRIKM